MYCILHNYTKDQKTKITGCVNVSSTVTGGNLTNLPHQKGNTATNTFSVNEQHKMSSTVLLNLLAGKTNRYKAFKVILTHHI
jgi:hypothetical protein